MNCVNIRVDGATTKNTKFVARLLNILRGVERSFKIHFSRRKEFINLGEERDAFV